MHLLVQGEHALHSGQPNQIGDHIALQLTVIWVRIRVGVIYDRQRIDFSTSSLEARP